MYEPCPLVMTPDVNWPRPLVTCFLPNSARGVVDDEEDMVRWKEMGVAGCAGAAKYPIFDAVLTDLEPLQITD